MGLSAARLENARNRKNVVFSNVQARGVGTLGLWAFSSSEPLGARNRCAQNFRSHWELEIAAPSGSGATGSSKPLPPVLPEIMGARNRCPQCFQSHLELEIAAPRSSGATGRSKTLRRAVSSRKQRKLEPTEDEKTRDNQKTRTHWGHLARENFRKPRTLEKIQGHRELGITVHSSQSLFEIAFRNHCSR